MTGQRTGSRRRKRHEYSAHPLASRILPAIAGGKAKADAVAQSAASLYQEAEMRAAFFIAFALVFGFAWAVVLTQMFRWFFLFTR